MGILGKLFGRKEENTSTIDGTSLPSAPVVASTVNDNSTVTLLNLTKGDVLDLNKYSTSLTKVRAAAGWSINTGIGSNYDLDLCAYLLANGSVQHIVYYGKKQGPGLHLDGDNLTGSSGQDDDENIFVTLNSIPPKIDRIVFAVVIYEAHSRHQKFGNVKNAYMRLVDESTGKEICRYPLAEDGGANTAATLAALNRTPSGWQFEAIGKYSKDSIESLGQKIH